MIYTFFLKMTNTQWSETDERLLTHVSAERASTIAQRKQGGSKKLSLYSALLTRFALAEILNIDAASLEFVTCNNQKPRLKSEDFHIDFSFSHTQGAVLLAICDNGFVGADIENYKKRRAPFQIMNRFFCEAERTYVNEGLHEESLRFYECWTSKEAFLKKSGVGLNTCLSAINTLDESISRSLVTWCTNDHVCSVCADIPVGSEPLSPASLNITHLNEEELRRHIL